VHGEKDGIPLWGGSPDPGEAATDRVVSDFAAAIGAPPRCRRERPRGILLGWAFHSEARAVARRRGVRLVELGSEAFREDIAALSGEHPDYAAIPGFVMPLQVHVTWEQLGPFRCRFDLSDSVPLNRGASIVSVQWDFAYNGSFRGTPGQAFRRAGTRGPCLRTEHTFAAAGVQAVACRVQDDAGGEALWEGAVELR